ncbi:MAG: GNAT family N-acetyltransferase, partial [Bacteroidota bacterium]
GEISLFRQMIQLFQEVFEVTPSPDLADEYLNQRLADERFIVCVAIEEARVVGGITAYELPMYAHPMSEWLLYDIAIHPDFQRRGVGRKLVYHLQQEVKQRGGSDIFLDAHEEDVHALAFYRELGAKEEKVRQFTFSSR